MPLTAEVALPAHHVHALSSSSTCSGRTPLHWAVLGGRLAAVKALLKHSTAATSEDDQVKPCLFSVGVNTDT